MTANLIGLQDELASAELAVAALKDARACASRFDRAGIERALDEAIQAFASLNLEWLDTLTHQQETRHAHH